MATEVNIWSGPSGRNHPVEAVLDFNIDIRQRFCSSKSHELFRVCTQSMLFPAKSITSPSPDFLDFITRVLSDPNIPFPLENIRWKDRNSTSNVGYDPLNNHEELKNGIINKAQVTIAKYIAESDKKRLSLTLTIERKETLPDDQYEAIVMKKYKEERSKEFTRFVFMVIKTAKEHKSSWDLIEALIKDVVSSQRLPSTAALDEVRDYKNKLLKAMIGIAKWGFEQIGNGCGSMCYEKLQDKQECCICYGSMNKLQQKENGKNNTLVECEEERSVGLFKLPCSHIFHPKCVQKWLMKNPTCPLCRKRVAPLRPPICPWCCEASPPVRALNCQWCHFELKP